MLRLLPKAEKEIQRADANERIFLILLPFEVSAKTAISPVVRPSEPDARGAFAAVSKSEFLAAQKFRGRKKDSLLN
jgi:hypothetical protein